MSLLLLVPIALGGYALQAQAADWPRLREPVSVPGWLQTAAVPFRLAGGLPLWLVLLGVIAAFTAPARPATIIRVLLRGLTLEAVILSIKVVTTLPFVLPLSSAAGSEFLVAEPDIGAGFWDVPPAGAPVLTLPASFPSARAFDIWLRLRAPDGAANSVHVGLDGVVQGDPIEVRGDGWWRWTNVTMSGDSAQLRVDEPGSHDLTIWPREDGVQVDQIVIAAGFEPGPGPVDSDDPGVPGIVVALDAASAGQLAPGSAHVWETETDGTVIPIRHLATAISHADFPSAHTARATFLAGAVIATKSTTTRRRRRAFAAAIVTAVAAASWISDAHGLAGIIAGIAIGAVMWQVAMPSPPANA